MTLDFGGRSFSQKTKEIPSSSLLCVPSFLSTALSFVRWVDESDGSTSMWKCPSSSHQEDSEFLKDPGFLLQSNQKSSLVYYMKGPQHPFEISDFSQPTKERTNYLKCRVYFTLSYEVQTST